MRKGKGSDRRNRSLYIHKTPLPISGITNASITFHQVQGYLAKGSDTGRRVPLTKQVRSEARGRCGGRFITEASLQVELYSILRSLLPDGITCYFEAKAKGQTKLLVMKDTVALIGIELKVGKISKADFRECYKLQEYD